MSGPPYPPPAAAGSNGIGEFVIGVSQIGDIPPFDYRSTIVSQYANSPIIQRLIDNLFAYLDQTKNINQFFDLVLNIDTAQGYGLDVWGRIVGINRVVQVTVTNWFGFHEAVPGSAGFGQAAFYGGESLVSNYALEDQSYRQLIIAKAISNVTNGSIPAINQILMYLFPHRGNAYVTEGSNASGPWFGFAESTTAVGFNQASFYAGGAVNQMTMTYTFKFQLTPVEMSIVQTSGVLPKPVGVQASIVISP